MILACVQTRKKVILRLTQYLMHHFVLFQSEVLLYKAVWFEYQCINLNNMVERELVGSCDI